MAKKKTPKILEETFKIEFCNYTLHIAYCDDPLSYRNNEFLKKFPKFEPDPSNDWVAVHLHDPVAYPRHSFIIFPAIVDPAIVVHEIVHVVDRIIEYFGFEGTEIRAYMVEYFFNKVLKRT